MASSSASSDIDKGRKRALAELQSIYEGPLKGLQIAPEFFRLLQEPGLKDTPLGKSYTLQNKLLDTALHPNRGGNIIPAGVASAVSEQLGSQLAARGIEGSPAAALAAANRFTGVSEQIRESRINQALNILGATGQGSIFPSAQQFLGVGEQRALTGAGIEMQAGIAQGQLAQQQASSINSLIGTAFGAVTGGLLGGGVFGSVGQLGQGGLGGFLGGFGGGAGLLSNDFLKQLYGTSTSK